MKPTIPRLSIIIPAYNVEAYIEAALDSVFEQQLPPHEVIVINDGSTDSTADKIARYAQQPNLKCITTSNQGLGPARNEGLRHACGDYIHFFDSDDVLDPRFMATIASIIEADANTDLILFSGKNFHDAGISDNPSNDLLRPFAARRLSGDSAVARLVQAGTPSPCAYLYVSKRDLWLRHELAFKPVLHEDNGVFLPLVLAADNVTIIRDILLHRRIRPKSIMSGGKTLAHAEGLLIAAQTLTNLYIGSSDRPKGTRRAIRKRAIRNMQRYLRTSNKLHSRINARTTLDCAMNLRSTAIVASAIANLFASSIRFIRSSRA